MKLLHAILIVGLATAVLVLVYPERKEDPVPAFLEDQKELTGFETKTDGSSLVTISVTPLNLSEQDEMWEFDVVLDTHSVELDYDMVQVSTLLDNNRASYKPIEWQGDPPGGHHRQGKLIFKSIRPTPSSIKIEMSDIGTQSGEVFRWKL
jgi:hypothetical protein